MRKHIKLYTHEYYLIKWELEEYARQLSETKYKTIMTDDGLKDLPIVNDRGKLIAEKITKLLKKIHNQWEKQDIKNG